tara:strand:+ start:45 stop:665 length:621 start_codon:yes stop_codon:yes gene_type:complete
MRTLKYRELIPNSTLTEKKVFDLNSQNHSSVTLVMHSVGANVRVNVKYVFEADGGSSTLSAAAVQPITGCTAADPAVFTCTGHGYLVGDIVSIRGNRFAAGIDPHTSEAAATYLSAYEVEKGVITAKATNTITIGEHSTAGASSFAGSGYAVYEGTEKQIQTVDLVADTLTILNFDMKVPFIRVTRDDNGSTCAGGVLRIDATTAK